MFKENDFHITSLMIEMLVKTAYKNSVKPHFKRK